MELAKLVTSDLPADLATTVGTVAELHRLSAPEIVESSVRMLFEELRREAQREKPGAAILFSP